MPIWGSNFDYGDSLYKDEGEYAGDTLFYFLPNWKFAINLKYLFKTALSTKRRKGEQRKALYRTPIRELSFSVTDEILFEKIWHYLMSKHDESFLLPLYTEPCKVQGSGSLLGVNSILVNDISDYHNLNNYTTYVLLIDLRYDDEGEILWIDSLTNDTINVTTNIVNNFLRQTSYIFPLVDVFLYGHERIDVTDKMTKFVLTCREYK